MNNPYLSIIIPCLNEQYFLPKILKNLSVQTFTDFEVIVVDGKSEDKTIKVATKFENNYPLHIYSTKIRNVSFQRNLGAKKAHGKILIFFDADTQIPKNYLKKIAITFGNKHPHFLTTYINVKTKRPLENIYTYITNFAFEMGKITKHPLANGAMQAVKKDAFFDVGGYDTQTKFGEDGQLFQKLQDFNYKYMVLKNPCYTFSLRRTQSTSVINSLIKQFSLILNVMIHGYHTPLKEEYQMGGKRYQKH